MTQKQTSKAAQPLEIFKPGTHTDIRGKKLTFSAADLEGAVLAYDPAIYEAPLVVGHPTLEAAAYGWVKKLAYADDRLLAEADQVDVQFAELVNSGRFKRISPSFFLPDAPDNPVPGSYYLHHVGFLGAAAPAVQGLKSAQFSADTAGLITFAAEMDGWDMGVIGRLFGRIRDLFIEKHGLEAADAALPPDDLAWFQQSAGRKQAEDRPAFAAPQLNNPETITTMTDPTKAAELAAREADLKKKQEDFAKQQAQFAASQTKLLRDADAALVEALIKEGKMTPAMKSGVLAFMAKLDNVGVVSFAAAEGQAATDQDARAYFADFLGKLPKVVEFKEMAKPGTAPSDGRASFAAAPGFAVNTDKLAIHEKALAYQQEHPGVTYEAAINAVS